MRIADKQIAMRASITLATIFCCLTASAAPAPNGSVARPVSGDACSALTALPGKELPNPTTVITAARFNAASPAESGSGRGAGASRPALPEHCEVTGKMNEKNGVNSQPYAIHFHLRLPSDWNGRLFYQAGGGTEGNLGTATGTLPGQPGMSALALGYAVLSQDSGHDNMVNNDPQLNGTSTFGYDPQARSDYGYMSYDSATQAAKAIVAAYYGKRPDKSYFVGCSSGGREALMMSQRYPDDYDGILSCSGAFEMPRALVAGIWDTQAWAEVAKQAGLFDSAGQPFVDKAFTYEDVELVANAVLAACDDLDGLADGIVDNFPACTTARVAPKLGLVIWKIPKDASCLSSAQVVAMVKVMGGPKNSKGEALYTDWPWDSGIGGLAGGKINKGWRDIKMGAYDAPKNASQYAGLGSAIMSGLFMTPPVPIAADGSKYLAYALNFNFDTDAPKIFAKGGIFKESAWDFMMPNSSDLSAFRKHNGKLLIINGVSDPDFSFNNIARWWQEVDERNHGKGDEFVRLFAVPGMDHVTGGPATDHYAAFQTLVDWVEKGAAPGRIEATATETTPWPGRTRPLCPYPLQSRYKGTGDIEKSENFVCKTPK